MGMGVDEIMKCSIRLDTLLLTSTSHMVLTSLNMRCCTWVNDGGLCLIVELIQFSCPRTSLHVIFLFFESSLLLFSFLDNIVFTSLCFMYSIVCKPDGWAIQNLKVNPLMVYNSNWSSKSEDGWKEGKK